MKESYLTKSGNLVFYYCPYADDFRECEKAALIKHGLVEARITTIGVTRRTDFLKMEAK